MDTSGERRRKETRYNRNSTLASRQSASTPQWFIDMRMWCRGKWWLPRLTLLLWFTYIWINLLRDPHYNVIFDALNLSIHELGHYLWRPFGEFMMFLGGSMTQCLAPIASILMFYRQRDYFAMAFCLGWLSTNLYSLANYIGDARAQVLPLVTPGSGEPIHDWHYLLNRLGLLNHDLLFATITRGLAAIAMLTFLLTGTYQIWLMITLPKGISDTPAEQQFEQEMINPQDD